MRDILVPPVETFAKGGGTTIAPGRPGQNRPVSDMFPAGGLSRRKARCGASPGSSIGPAELIGTIPAAQVVLTWLDFGSRAAGHQRAALSRENVVIETTWWT
jgi:hypothetical protein